MKKYIIIASLICTVSVAKSQQLQSSSLYDMQGIIHNPSIAGVMQDETVKGIAGVAYRTQWSGISGSPTTFTAFGSFKIPSLKMGIGGSIYNDKTGPTSRTGIALDFAKHINFNDGGVFSLGIETRFLQYSLDRNKLTATLGADPALGTSDTRFKFDAGFGASYTNKQFQIGASVSQLVQSKLDYYTGTAATSEVARLYRHYYLHGQYNWNVDDNFTVTPNALMIYLPNAPVEFQGGARVEYKKLLWWGVGYRLNQNFMLSAGVSINNKLMLGYSYDIYRTPISNFDGGNGAHELMLKFNIQK